MDPVKNTPTPEIKLHFLDYWRIIRMRKTIIFSVFLLVVLTVTFVSMKLEQRFMSTAKILVEKNATDIPEIAGRGALISGFDPFYIQTQFEVIKSSSILEPVVETNKLREVWGKRLHNGQPLTMQEAVEILGRRLSLDQTRNTSCIEISVQSEDREEAAVLANAIANEYANWRREQASGFTKGGLAKLKEQLDKQVEVVAALAKSVDELRKKHNIMDMDPFNPSPSSSTLEESTITHLDRIRGEQKASFTELKSLYDRLNAMSPKERQLAIPPPWKDYSLADAIAIVNKANLDLQSARKSYGPNHPEVEKFEATKELAEKQLAVTASNAFIQLQVRMDAASNSLFQTEVDLKAKREQELERNESTRPYWLAKQQLRTESAYLDILRFKLKGDSDDAELPKNSAVQMYDKATPARIAYRPNIPLNIVIGVVVGLMVGVGLAFFIEYLDTSVKTIDDVERSLQSPVLGVIPQNVGKIIEEGPESPHAEAYRVLRTNILFSRKSDKHNTITIVSGGAGEGKSTTLFNLATVFAQTGERIIIVDSDLRRPSLHKMLNVSNSIGLTNYLLRQNTLEEVIQTSSIPSLDLMPSGKLPSSSMGILSSPQMKELIQELKKRYDYVFFDSPPIMGVSDASILASEMDMTLQVIQYRRYPQQMTIRAKQMIEKVGGNLLGIVLNNISMGQDDNYYYYSGYYYDYYSKNEENGEPKKAKKNENAKLEIKRKF